MNNNIHAYESDVGTMIPNMEIAFFVVKPLGVVLKSQGYSGESLYYQIICTILLTMHLGCGLFTQHTHRDVISPEVAPESIYFGGGNYVRYVMKFHV